MAFVDVFAPTLNVWRVLGYELDIIKITNLLFRFQLHLPFLLYLIKQNLTGIHNLNANPKRGKAY